MQKNLFAKCNDIETLKATYQFYLEKLETAYNQCLDEMKDKNYYEKKYVQLVLNSYFDYFDAGPYGMSDSNWKRYERMFSNVHTAKDLQNNEDVAHFRNSFVSASQAVFNPSFHPEGKTNLEIDHKVVLRCNSEKMRELDYKVGYYIVSGYNFSDDFQVVLSRLKILNANNDEVLKVLEKIEAQEMSSQEKDDMELE